VSHVNEVDLFFSSSKLQFLLVLTATGPAVGVFGKDLGKIRANQEHDLTDRKELEHEHRIKDEDKLG